MNDHDINQQAAAQICRAFAWNGRSFTEGECVALLDGKVVADAGDLESAANALRALDPNPRRGMVLEVAAPVIDVIR